MPLSMFARTVANEFFLPLQAIALSPFAWGLVYLGVTNTSSAQYFAVVAMFGFCFYAVHQIAYHSFYYSQAVLAHQALQEVEGPYELFVTEPAEFLGTLDVEGLDLDTGTLQIVIAEQATANIPPFLNYRAYLQPQGKFRSIALISRQTTAQQFFLLHELGHLSPKSHYHALYGRHRTLRLAITYVPFLFLSPSWLVVGLILLACFLDWFLLGAIRREYMADSFAWSILSRAGEDVRLHARRIATVFRYARPKDETESIELPNRKKLCQMILDTDPDSVDAKFWTRGDRWLKEDLLTLFAVGAYSSATWLMQALLTLVAIWQFDGGLIKITAFLLVTVWIATVLRIKVSNKALPAYDRLGGALETIPLSARVG